MSDILGSGVLAAKDGEDLGVRVGEDNEQRGSTEREQRCAGQPHDGDGKGE